MVERETERLLLRGFGSEDFEDYCRLMSDGETQRFLFGKPLDREGAWRSLAGVLGHWQLRGYGLWAVEEKATGDLVGRVGLIHPEGWPGLEVGWLVDRRRWGEGFAPEAAREALAYAFGVLEADHVISIIDPENHASVRVAEKIGEVFERKLPFHGKEVSIFGIRRAAWNGPRGGERRTDP